MPASSRSSSGPSPSTTAPSGRRATSSMPVWTARMRLAGGPNRRLGQRAPARRSPLRGRRWPAPAGRRSAARASSRRVGMCSLGTSVRRVVAQRAPRHGLAVHLVGAVVDAGGPGGAVHVLEREVAGEPERAVDLDGPVDHVVEDAGAEVLDHRDLDAGPPARPPCPSSTPRAGS